MKILSISHILRCVRAIRLSEISVLSVEGHMQPTQSKAAFDLERYLDNSKKVQISDLDFTKAKDYPLSPDEIRCLSYMMDIENHTLSYLRGLMKTCAVRDPETVAFLSCWVYEEFFHGRAIRQFLHEVGMDFSANHAEDVRKRRSWRESFEEFAASMLCHIIPDFHAVYFAWGAIQELTTLEAYGVLARRTQNPVLRELLCRIAKDERRHFSFYFSKARPLLQSKASQKVTRIILRYFWTPVGDGVKSIDDVHWTMRFVFNKPDAREVTHRIDSVIARLPGLGWFNLVSSMKGLRGNPHQAPAEACA